MWHARRIGTTTMEAYAIAAQIINLQQNGPGQRYDIYWIIPHTAWRYQCWTAFLGAAKDYDIKLYVAGYRISVIPDINIWFTDIKRFEEESIRHVPEHIFVAGLSEVSKWPSSNYPDWIYDNIPQRVPVIDYRLRVL